MKEIKVVFYANVKADDYRKVVKDFDKYGAKIIGDEFPELKDIGSFSVEEVAEESEPKEREKDNEQ